MVQQLAVSTILCIVYFTIAVNGRRRINTNVFNGNNDKNSSPPPSHQFWLYQGDIMLKTQQEDMIDIPNKKIDTSKAFSQRVQEKRVWFGGIIPYVFDCSLKNMPGLINIVKGAMREWEAKTCVSFVERQNEEDFVRIIRGTHCYSTVGRVKGEKVLSVGYGCEYHNVMLHELGHSIGFWHEQSRPDRDEHVRVLWRNISPGWESAFVKLSYQATSSVLLPYDFSSIMHYPFNAFSKNSRRKTIVSLRPVKARPYKTLSHFDVLRVNMLYGCKGTHSNDVDSTEASSMEAYRRMKRAIEDENVEQYKPERKQRSILCKDNEGEKSCRYWAEKGFCITRKDFMLDDCAKSCNACRTDDHYRPSHYPHGTVISHAETESVAVIERSRRIRRREAKRKARKEVKDVFKQRNSCHDKMKKCSYLAKKGFCAARPDLMLRKCAKSCNKCYPDPSNCVDRDSRCKTWAKYHYCRQKRYKTVMESFCKKSCGHCISDQEACRDKEYDKCSDWVASGLCTSRDKEVKEAMNAMCAMSCGACAVHGVEALCKDDFTACHQWQKKGHCESRKDFMNKYCKKTCKRCIVAGNQYKECLDNSVLCGRMKAAGRCEKNRYGMLSLCRKTCGFCVNQVIKVHVPCKDKSSACSIWSKLGYCDNGYRLFMMGNCEKSCGFCSDSVPDPYIVDVDVRPSSRILSDSSRILSDEPCYNVYKECDYWARIGMCSIRPDLMLRKCNLACRACYPETKCKNIEDENNCIHWAKLGKCSSRPNFMIDKCPKSCNACPSREIKTKPEKPVGILCPTACKKWLEQGHCSKLKNRCRRTCLANGCDTEPLRPYGFCGYPMGAGWDFKLPDSAFNASSVLAKSNWDFGAHNARLYKEDDPVYRRVGGWCAKKRKDQWLQVDLGSTRIITAVATQGRDKFFEHVKSYELGFSNDGKKFYKYKENGTNKILRGNCDHFTPVINSLRQPYAARYVRFYPKTHSNICMRVEIYGCNSLEGKTFKRYGKVVYPDQRKHV